MITLLTFPPGFGAFSVSGFCVKARHLLHLSGQDWQREDLDNPGKAPFGKLPAIRVGGRVIGDSAQIRAYLEDQGADFDPGLNQAQKAQSHALVRMAEEHFYFISALDRWSEDQVWKVVRETYFASVPGALRGVVSGLVRRNFLKGMHGQGLGRLTPEGRLERAEVDLQAVKRTLGDKPFLMGDDVTSADLSWVPMLEAAMGTPVETGLRKRVQGDDQLVAYVARANAALGMETPA